MRSATKKTAAADPGQHALRSGPGAAGIGDAQSRQLARIQKKVGNAEAGTSVSGSANTRDGMLQFICERLRILQGIQVKEHKQLLDQRKWYREVARGKTGFALPDPTRWHESARNFKEAALALSHGNLQRGVQLLERALAEEQKAYDKLPQMVKEDLVAEEKAPSVVPDTLGVAATLPLAPACNPPADLIFADRMLSMMDEFVEEEPMLPWPKHNWWEADIEEEDEAEKKKKGKPAEAASEKATERPEVAQQQTEKQAPARETPELSEPAPEKDLGEDHARGH